MANSLVELDDSYVNDIIDALKRHGVGVNPNESDFYPTHVNITLTAARSTELIRLCWLPATGWQVVYYDNWPEAVCKAIENKVKPGVETPDRVEKLDIPGHPLPCPNAVARAVTQLVPADAMEWGLL